MRPRTESRTFTLSGFFKACILLTLLSAHSAAQRPELPVSPGQQTSGEFEWRFSVQQGKIAPSNVTAQNLCRSRQRFEVELQNLPFMSLLGPSGFDVSGGAEHNLPVKFDATNLTPGEYSGKVLIKCATCSKRSCTQDHQVLNVRMTVLPDAAPPSVTEQTTQRLETGVNQLKDLS